MCVPSNFDDKTCSIDGLLMLSSGSKESNEWAVDICLVEITIHLVLVGSIAKSHFSAQSSSFTRSDLILEIHSSSWLSFAWAYRVVSSVW